ARNPGRHRVQPGEPDELAGLGHLERPQAESLPVEQVLDAIDVGVTVRPAHRGREVPHHLRVGIHRRVGVPVTGAPAAHQQSLSADGVETMLHGYACTSGRWSAQGAACSSWLATLISRSSLPYAATSCTPTGNPSG